MLPFVLKGNARLSSPERETKKQRTLFDDSSKPIEGSNMGATYSVPLSTNVNLNKHKKELTMVPLQTSYSGSSPPLTFFAFEERDGFLHVPRFYGYSQFGKAETCSLTEGVAMDLEFNGTLNDIQKTAVEASLASLRAEPFGGVFVLPCGYGKTVCALFIAQQLKRRTLVLVHKSFLVSQWQERARMFLKDVSVGKIQQNVMDWDADVVIGMIQSVSKREYPQHVLDSFGLVVIDESHHMSAPVFSRALRVLSCKHVLGLSATPERKDGMTRLLYYSMGAVSHRVEREPEHALVSCILFEATTKRKEIACGDGKVSLPLMLNALAKDIERNRVIASHIHRLMSVGRNIIVLSDRISQLEYISSLLFELGCKEEDVSFYIGKTPASQREEATKRSCILSTYSMAKEGLDIPRLDTLVLASPKGDVIQATGRVQRKCEGKAIPLVVDIVDTFSVFETLRWKRWKFYKKQGFSCQSFSSFNEDGVWFT